MPVEPLRYRGLECTVCGRDDFDGMDQFKGHIDADGQPCPGGTPA